MNDSYTDRDEAILNFARKACADRGLMFEEVWPNAGYLAGEHIGMKKGFSFAPLTLCRIATTKALRTQGTLGSFVPPSYPEMSRILNGGERRHSQFIAWNRAKE